MKKFIKYIIIHVLALMVLIFVIKQVAPFYWGAPNFATKINYFQNNVEDYNTVVIGNSMILNGLIPKVFDSHTKTGTKTYNLGVGGTLHHEAWYLTEEIIKSLPAGSIDNIIFLSSNWMNPRNDENIHSSRAKYYLDFKRFFNLLPQLYYLQTKLEVFSGNMYYYFISFMENQFLIGEWKNVLGQIFGNNTIEITEEDKYQAAHNGFLSKNYILDELKIPHSIKRHDYFLKNQAQGLKRMTVRPLESTKNKNLAEGFHEQSLKDIERLCTVKNINFYPLYMPNDSLNVKFPDFNNIYMGDGVDFPEYFDVDNRFDMMHLNEKGARLFSRRLAHLFIEQKTQ